MKENKNLEEESHVNNHQKINNIIMYSVLMLVLIILIMKIKNKKNSYKPIFLMIY